MRSQQSHHIKIAQSSGCLPLILLGFMLILGFLAALIVVPCVVIFSLLTGRWQKGPEISSKPGPNATFEVLESGAVKQVKD